MVFSPNDFVHPEDKAALEQLEAIPGFSLAVKSFLAFFNEKLVHGMNMASKIRLGPKQLPKIYRHLPPICDRLGIDEPEFYLELNPSPNAFTTGDTHASITVTSGLLQALDKDEFQAVLAHECGHIVCRHVLYHTMAGLLVQGTSFIGPLAAIAAPIRLGLLYWSRRSEFSADRAAAVVLGDAKPVIETMIRLAGGPKAITGGVDLEQYIAQASDFDELIKSSTWDKMLQSLAVMHEDHPFPSVRAREIRRWSETGEFRRLVESARGSVAAKRLEDGLPQNVIRCATCGSAVAGDWRFCVACGQVVNAS
jgi:Zn-dependent protease with chaperone function